MTASSFVDERLMCGFPPPPEHRVRLDRVYEDPRLTHWYMQHVREVCGTADVSDRRSPVVPLPEDPLDLDHLVVARADGGRWALHDLLRETYVDGIAVLRRGRLVYERYFHGMRPQTPHLHQSITKSLASCVCAALVEEGALGVDDEVAAVVPELAGSAYGDARVRHLLDMSVGIDYADDLDRPEYDGARLCRLEGVQPALADDEPGSAYDFATTTRRQGDHGSVFHYVSLNSFVLGWVMERATGTAVPELLRTRLWSKLGAEHDAFIALDAAGSAHLDGGFASSLRDLARFGLMLCQGGVLGESQVVPAWWIDDVRRNGDEAAFAAAAATWEDGRAYEGCSYRSCFWVSEAADHVTFSGVGWLGQRVHVVQETGVVVAMFSSRPPEQNDEMSAHAFAACEDLSRLLA